MTTHTLDKTGAEIDVALGKAHDQNTDTMLDSGGANEVSAEDLAEAINTTIPAKVDQVSATENNIWVSDGSGGLKDSGKSVHTKTMDALDYQETYGLAPTLDL